MKGAEQGEVLPAVAVARKIVVVSLLTLTVSPAPAKAASVPVAARLAGVQSAAVGAL